MRKIHRWVSVPAGMFLGLIGIRKSTFRVIFFSNITFRCKKVIRRRCPWMSYRDCSKILARMRRLAPGARISIELSARGGVPHADVIFADPGGRTQTFDAGSGELSAQPAGGPLHESRRLRLRLRALALELHQGGIIGVAGGWLGWICGLALVTRDDRFLRLPSTIRAAMEAAAAKLVLAVRLRRVESGGPPALVRPVIEQAAGR